MRVFLSRKAAKELEETPSQMRRRLEEKISQLSLTPYPAGSRRLKGAPNAYRLLYAILSKDEILVFKIARRETAYL